MPVPLPVPVPEILLAISLAAAPGTPHRPPSPPPVTLELQDADIHDVLRTLADLGRVNIVTTPEVSGRVSGRFTKVPWDEALRQILSSLQLTMERDGNVIYVDRA